MEFKGLEIYNCRELVLNEETGGYRISRIPMSLAEKMKANPFLASGVELRFVPLEKEIRIVLRARERASRVVIFYGSIQSGWQNLYKEVYSTPTEIVIPRADNLEKLKLVTERNGYPYSEEVVRVILQNSEYEIFDIKGKCVPPSREQLPSRTYLAYGSSITHGSLAMVQANTFVSRIGEYFKADPVNFGFAGSARLEKEVADYIARECRFDFATLEMGINILDVEPEEFRKRVTYFASAIAGAHPEQKIFCIDLFYMERDLLEPENENSKPNVFRRIVREVVQERNLPNVIYIRGLDMMKDSGGLSQDLVHPNARGVEEIAGNLCRVMENYL
ncbi:MAG: SGNH/GDSL hydrolase family protein [Candidatus Limivivens sp.]|nr:SGNH/GDSL hydrolase family protein [Candidatus Limivivens sp.]